jgi:DNA-binding NtrC family response regulator
MTDRILFVDDDVEMREMVKEALKKRDFKVDVCASADEAISALQTEDYDAVVTDVNMQGMTGLEFCRYTNQNRPDIPVILITAFGSMEAAIGAIRAGAYDFIAKPIQMDDLALTISRATQLRSLRDEVKRLRNEVATAQTIDDMVGTSPAMKGVYQLLERVADSDATVLITGESGTGKELIARAVHSRSRRREGPFVAINCAALPESILESELFGHVRGAFTDAKSAKAGLFARADGGTLFLDEIGEMPLGMQVKLLRALQERVVRPVGGEQEIPFDARIVAATNRDLETDVAEHRFREDLYYRVNVVRISMPPLRARGNDVLLIAQHFLERVARQSSKKVLGFSSAAAEKLLTYDWPGNVRELQNCVERVVALATFDQIMVDDLPSRIREHQSNHFVIATENPTELLSMEEVERRYILRVLRAVNGNKTVAAQVLGFDRRTLYRRLERYGESGGGSSEERGDSSPPRSMVESQPLAPSAMLT